MTTLSRRPMRRRPGPAQRVARSRIPLTRRRAPIPTGDPKSGSMIFLKRMPNPAVMSVTMRI